MWLGQGFVDGVTSNLVGTLIFWLRHGTVQAAEVSGTSTDVDDQSVIEEVEAVGHSRTVLSKR